MSSHRRPGFLERWGLRRTTQAESVPRQRRLGVELVDARSRIAHRVSDEEMLANHRAGACRARCGARVLAASLTDPGLGQCRRCEL